MSASEELFRLAMDAAQLGAYRVDYAADSIEFSGKTPALFDLPARMSLAAFDQRVLEADRDRLTSAIGTAAAGGDGTYQAEFRLLSPEGAVRWMRAVGRFAIGDGTIDHVGILMDISAERDAREELRARENWFRALIENATDLITVLDPTARIIYKSPSSHVTLGYEPGQLVGSNALDFVHADDLEAARRVIAASLEQPERMLHVEVRFRAADESWRTLSCNLVNLMAHPDVRGIVVNSRDVTEERALEHDLQQSRRLEAVGQLAGGIAHDFNNLLTAIKGGTHFALDETGPDHPAYADLEQVQAAADRAAQLTRQLLTFSRRQPARMRVHDLNDVIPAVVPMLSRLIGEDIRLEVSTANEPAHVKVDPAQFEQVIINLVVNARDAMPGGGTIEIDVSHVDLPGDARVRFEHDVAPGRYVRMCVADSGVGIPPELRAHIFEPFFTTKEPGRGTGLGLPTVYGIVKQANGYIRVDSRRSRGTAFEVYLSAVAPPSRDGRAEAPALSTDESGLDGLHVLLCEDEDAVRSLARRMLEPAGCLVTEAPDGRSALELAAATRVPIDLLITDVVMPGMSGRELAAEIGVLHPEASILFISGYPEREIAQRGILAGDVHYLHKPFDRASLLDAVGRAIGATI